VLTILLHLTDTVTKHYKLNRSTAHITYKSSRYSIL